MVAKTVHIHCSDSSFGSKVVIEGWHRAKKWREIGYHFVINNCYEDSKDIRLRLPDFDRDGKIEEGRDLDRQPASIKGFNKDAIAICLVGKDTFTGKQFESLVTLIKELKTRFQIISIVGHYELDDKKTCPDIDMDYLRKKIDNSA